MDEKKEAKKTPKFTGHPPKSINFSAMGPALSIHNINSDLDSLYHIKTPFLVTLEYCSGTGPEDFINILTLSTRESFFYQETAAQHHLYFTKYSSHFHDYFELMIVLKGCITQKIGEQEYLYHAGTCCLVNRSLGHREDFNACSQVLFLGLSAEFAMELFDSCKTAWYGQEKEILDSELLRFIEKDIKTPGQKAYLDFIPAWQNSQFPHQLHALVDELLQLLFTPGFGTTYQLKGLFCRILAYLSAPSFYHCTCVTLDSASDFLLFSRVTHLMEESDGRISRAQLGRALNYSGDYLNRIVNKYAGMCLFDYGMTFCLKKAAIRLSGTDESISSIAASLHFTNRTHFYTLFKKQYGITPKEYREQNRPAKSAR